MRHGRAAVLAIEVRRAGHDALVDGPAAIGRRRRVLFADVVAVAVDRACVADEVARIRNIDQLTRVGGSRVNKAIVKELPSLPASESASLAQLQYEASVDVQLPAPVVRLHFETSSLVGHL